MIDALPIEDPGVIEDERFERRDGRCIRCRNILERVRGDVERSQTAAYIQFSSFVHGASSDSLGRLAKDTADVVPLIQTARGKV